MLGTIVNCLAVFIGGCAGLLFRNGIPDKYNHTVMQGVSLSVILVGVKSALGSDDLLVIIVSLALGSLIGEWIDIEAYLKRMGDWLERRFSKASDPNSVNSHQPGSNPSVPNRSGGFSTGFVTASLIFCVGSMAIVGSLESGLMGKHDILYAKSALDGIVSLILSSSLGFGVIFSAVPILVYQGSITLLAGFVKPVLVPEVVSQMSATGGLLIIGIGLNMLREKKLRVGNMLPAIFIPLIYYLVKQFF